MCWWQVGSMEKGGERTFDMKLSASQVIGLRSYSLGIIIKSL